MLKKLPLERISNQFFWVDDYSITTFYSQSFVHHNMSNTTTQISSNMYGLWPRLNWIKETFTCVKWNISIARHFDQVFFNFHFELAFHNVHQGGYWFAINDMENYRNIRKLINFKVVKLWFFSFKNMNKRRVHIIQWNLFLILFWLWLEVENFDSCLHFYQHLFLHHLFSNHFCFCFIQSSVFVLDNLLQFIYYWFGIMLCKFEIFLA
jgi:hypothetical protein